jgi:predicted metal-dependent hydrolase
VVDKKRMSEPRELDPRYLKGIEHFNAREFFDAHEVWEELWNDEHGKAHEFVQGLIQFATSLHHFEASNMKGTMILYHGGVELLTPYGEEYWRLPVKKFIADMTQCVSGLFGYTQAELPGRYHPEKKNFPVQIQESLIPKIVLIEPS